MESVLYTSTKCHAVRVVFVWGFWSCAETIGNVFGGLRGAIMCDDWAELLNESIWYISGICLERFSGQQAHIGYGFIIWTDRCTLSIVSVSTFSSASIRACLYTIQIANDLADIAFATSGFQNERIPSISSTSLFNKFYLKLILAVVTSELSCRVHGVITHKKWTLRSGVNVEWSALFLICMWLLFLLHFNLEFRCKRSSSHLLLRFSFYVLLIAAHFRITFFSKVKQTAHKARAFNLNIFPRAFKISKIHMCRLSFYGFLQRTTKFVFICYYIIVRTESMEAET